MENITYLNPLIPTIKSDINPRFLSITHLMLTVLKIGWLTLTGYKRKVNSQYKCFNLFNFSE